MLNQLIRVNVGPPATASGRTRWALLLISMTAAMTTTAAVNCVSFLIPQLIEDRGIDYARAGMLAACASVGLLVTTIAWGALIDRHGERTILILSLTGAVFGLGGAAWAFAAAAPLWLIGIFLFLGAAMAASCNGASGRIVVGYFPANKRGMAMGVRQTSQPLMIGLMSISMPVLAHTFSVGIAMLVPLAWAALSLVLVLVGITDPPRPTTAPRSPNAPAAAPASDNPYKRDNFLARIHLSSLLLTIPQAAIWTFGNSWLQHDDAMGPAAAGLLVASAQLLGAGGRIGAGIWSDRVGSRTAPVRQIAFVAAASVGALAALAGTGSSLAAAVFVIASVVTVADNGLNFTAVAERSGPGWSGRALGVQNTGQFAATTATTPLLGAVVDHSGFALMFGIVAVLPVLALTILPDDRASAPNREAI